MQPALPRNTTGADADASASLLINSNLIALALADQDRLLFVNAAFRRLFDRPGGLEGVSILELVPPAHRGRLATALSARHGPPSPCIAEAFRGESRTFEVEFRFDRVMVDGESRLAIFAQDVTDSLKVEARLNLLAFSDPLTDLGNRAMFADRLRHATLTTRQTAQPFAVLVLNLDGFRRINDLHGHGVGDRVLRRVAARLLAFLPESDTVVRLGGDEFAVLLRGLDARADAMAMADRLIELTCQPIELETFAVKVGASVGVAVYPDHSSAIDQLLAAADRALFAAKRQGRGRAVWATPISAAETVPTPLVWNATHEVGIAEIDEQHCRLVTLLNDLADALRNSGEHAVILEEVIRYTGFHFATEEHLMRIHHYDGAAAHVDMHKRLLDDLRGLHLDGPSVSVSLVMRYLREWLLRHVDGADRDLAAALRASHVA